MSATLPFGSWSVCRSSGSCGSRNYSSHARENDVDAVAVRLLLNDYAAAVGHLRAFVAKAGERVDAAAVPLRPIRKFVWRGTKATDRGAKAVGDQTPEATPAEPAPAPPV